MQNKYDYIDWTQSANFKVGDIIYLYVSKPYQQIMYATEAIKVNLTEYEVADDKKYWLNPSDALTKRRKKYVRLKKIEFIDHELLALDFLIRNGLSKAPQGPVRVHQHLEEYIEAQFTSDYNAPEEISTKDAGSLLEGAITSIYINKYERNRVARNQCIAHYSPSCIVCKMDFKSVYGNVGKGFIHVHHIVPLKEVKATYKVNPITDLVPVCPNCHAMLRRKVNGKVLSLKHMDLLSVADFILCSIYFV